MDKQKATALAIDRGDVFQITEVHGRKGWIGAFVLATEIKDWGIQGFVHCIKTHDEQTSAYIRLTWNEIEFVGHAVMVPVDIGEQGPQEDKA